MISEISLNQIIEEFTELSGYAKVEINQFSERKITLYWHKPCGHISGEFVKLPTVNISFNDAYFYKSDIDAEGKPVYRKILIEDFVNNCELDFVYYLEYFESNDLEGFSLYSDIVNVEFSLIILFEKIISIEQLNIDYEILPRPSPDSVRVTFKNNLLPKSQELKHLFSLENITIFFKEYFGNTIEPDSYSYFGLQMTTDDLISTSGILIKKDCSEFQKLIGDSQTLILFEKYNSVTEPWDSFITKILPKLNFEFLIFGNIKFSKVEWIQYSS